MARSSYPNRSGAGLYDSWPGRLFGFALGIILIGWEPAIAMVEPELPSDPLCDLVRSWREQGVYQKALTDGHPALEGTIFTTLDADLVVDQVKATCAAYGLSFISADDLPPLPFRLVRVRDGDLERTFMIFRLPAGQTMVKFSFEEASDPNFESILNALPELSNIAAGIEFKKENFADRKRSALIVFKDPVSPEYSLEKAQAVLQGAGWTESDLSQPAKGKSTLCLTKQNWTLLLRANPAGSQGTSLICTISEKEDNRLSK